MHLAKLYEFKWFIEEKLNIKERRNISKEKKSLKV